MPITGDRDSDGRRIKSEPKAVAAKAEPVEPAESKPRYVGGQIVRDDEDDDWTGVRDHRVQSRKDLTDAIAAKGGSGKTYPVATNRLYDKMFRGGKPSGKLDDWSAEDQKRITVGNKVAKQYVEEGDDGHYGIITSIERGGAEANGRCNGDGTDSWWRKLTGRDLWEERERQEKQVVERRQTVAEQEDDSHLTEGQKALKRHRAEQSSSEGSGGGFLRSMFVGNGRTIWDGDDDDSSSSSDSKSEPAEEQESSGGFLRAVFCPKNYWDD